MITALLALQMLSIDVEGTPRTYYHNDKKEPISKFIFLHGLTPSITPRILAAFEKINGELDTLLIFPVGIKGAFPKSPEALAWSPMKAHENESFLKALMKKYPTERTFLGGFSNGAYFATNQLLSGTPLFDGYWIQGGGISGKASALMPKPVVLEIAKGDTWHLKPVFLLRDQLIDLGWQEGKTLLFCELPGGHSLDLTHLKTNWEFLEMGQGNNL